MFRQVWVAAAVSLAVACSGSHKPASPRAESPAPAPSAAGTPDAGVVAAPTADAGAAARLTAEDCDHLVAHIVDVAVREDAARHPEMPPPTAEALEAMRAALAEEMADACVGRERGVFDCAMRAHTGTELEACED